MSLMNFIRGQLIDIVEWLDDTRDTLAFRFWRPDNEIKHGAKLIVRESQVAAVVSEGQMTDLFLFPGTFTLETKNLPVLSTLRGWKYGFESPFKAEVYFVSTRTFTGNKWGTKNPIMLRDVEFGVVRLRAFGTYALRVSDPALFLKNITGTSGRFTLDQIDQQLRDLVVARFADVLGESKIPALDLAGNYDELGKFVTARIHDDFVTQFGIEIVLLTVENISLPAEVEAAMDKRTSMGVIGNLDAYTRFQTATAIGDAAKNPGGLAGAGAGLGAGFAMANQMSAALSQSSGAALAQSSNAALSQPSGAGRTDAPPALPAASVQFFVAINGQQAGPFDLQSLPARVSAGQLTPQSLVWKTGMAQWTPAAQVPELASLFHAAPPPLPALPSQG